MGLEMDKHDFDELLETLGWIVLDKSLLPFSLRGWVNALGLHVQERHAGGWTRIQAGGSLRSYLDAWRQKDKDRAGNPPIIEHSLWGEATQLPCGLKQFARSRSYSSSHAASRSS